jgi:hypothetical protein
MWMTEYQLGVQGIRHVSNVKLSFLVSYFGIEQYMQKHISELFPYFICRPFKQGLRQFICLLDGICAQALVRLFPVPWTLYTQNIEGVDYPPQGLELVFSCM